ncbi:hypothetical protein WDU94_005434 [Cyamophila willieti]
MLRQCRSYRTASTVSLQVISGTLPVELMAEERTSVYEARKTDVEIEVFKVELQENLMAKWQRKWDAERKKGQWTKVLISDIKSWVTRQHGDITYELCQFLTGHGNFGAYLYRMGISQDNKCRYCQEEDTPQHMVFHCVRWITQRTRCWAELGTAQQTPNSIVGTMLTSVESWNVISKYITETFKEKVTDIRRTLSTPPTQPGLGRLN